MEILNESYKNSIIGNKFTKIIQIYLLILKNIILIVK